MNFFIGAEQKQKKQAMLRDAATGNEL